MEHHDHQPGEELSSPGTILNTQANGHDDDMTIVATDLRRLAQTVATAVPHTDLSVDPTVEAMRPPRTKPTREQWLTAMAFGAVVLLGALLRFWGLGERPLHHDESLHAYFSLQLMHNIENWMGCFNVTTDGCYRYDPLLHGPFQFHMIALVYKISQLIGAADNGVNTTTVRIAAALLGSTIVGLPYFLRNHLGTLGAWLACFLLAISPSMVYFSRFAREDIYMACFTLLLVVSTVQYMRSRKMRWIILAAVAFMLSYATKEATFLTIAIFGSFLGALLCWELGLAWRLRERSEQGAGVRIPLPRTAAFLALAVYVIVLGIGAKWFFGWLKQLSTYLNASQANTRVGDAYVLHLKEWTVFVLPFFGIALAVYIAIRLWRELRQEEPPQGRRGLAVHVHPEYQPWLDTLLTTPWTYWFFALMSALGVFLLLFTVLFTNVANGIGDGIWQGLYYWIQQQQVARGGQPWYYYLLLIPLYEQIGLVFGLIGAVRCLLHPSRFRLFLLYWCFGSLLIYSWAGEKMPWLMIHITMPLMLLGALGLEPIVVDCRRLVAQWLRRRTAISAGATSEDEGAAPVSSPVPARSSVECWIGVRAGLGTLLALAILVVTLQNMFQVTYIHQADAPHEMMIYVQTTTDVNTIMGKIDTLDQQLYHGQHKLAIGVTGDATWPFAWYVRDYSRVCFQYPDGCAWHVEAIIIGGDTIPDWVARYGKDYAFHQYQMRTQWDQGYMPPPCVRTSSNPCTDPQPYTGVGPFLWLSYGDTPPANAHFDLGRAISNIWQWWWQRKAIGSTDGSYDMGLFIRKDLHTAP